MVYGANFRCVLHHASSLTHLKGSWGQLWKKTGPKHQQTKTNIIIFPRGLTATKLKMSCALEGSLWILAFWDVRRGQVLRPGSQNRFFRGVAMASIWYGALIAWPPLHCQVATLVGVNSVGLGLHSDELATMWRPSCDQPSAAAV